MSKIIGGIFTVIGFIMAAVNIFLYMNSSAYLNYNDPSKHLSFFETGLGVPSVLTFLLLAIGLTFLFVSREPRLK
jgi:glycerol uptake facilitator-like aquaporin